LSKKNKKIKDGRKEEEEIDLHLMHLMKKNGGWLSILMRKC
jgi:hypothetical protein